MDFKLSDQQKELQMTARNFAKKEMSEVADHMEHTSEPLSKDWLKKYSEMGFLGINVDEKYGGLGLSNLDALLVMEEFAKEGALFGDDENEDDMYAKYDLSDMVGDNGKSVFDFDRAYALSRAEDLEFEMHDECRNDISAINDEYFNANLQVEVRSFFLNLSNTNHQMYDHCLQTLDAEARENLSAAVKAYQIEQNMKINNNYDGVVEQKKDNLS